MAASAAGEPERASGRSGDLAQIEELQRRQYQAWADQDGAAFAATFSRDGDMVAFNGDYLRTRQGIAERMRYYFDNYIEPSTIRELSEHIRFADRHTAVIVRETCLVPRGTSDCRDGSHSTNTSVLAEHHHKWLHESFQNTRQFDLPELP